MWDRRAEYVSNHDGDTVTVVLDQGFYDTKQVNLRLANVWAPELAQIGGREVKKYVNTWFLDRVYSTKGQWQFIVVTYKTSTEHELKTFDRYVADVMTKDGKDHLNSDVMKFIVDSGYPGGTGS